jgi:Ni/Co efflux regulator RcnB
MLRIALAVVLALSAALATLDGAAQSGKRQDGGRERQMSQEERQRMRDDVRDAYRDRQERPQPRQPMSPEQREQLRRDIQNANKDLKR